jgi:hypothetical protein
MEPALDTRHDLHDLPRSKKIEAGPVLSKSIPNPPRAKSNRSISANYLLVGSRQTKSEKELLQLWSAGLHADEPRRSDATSWFFLC